MQKVENCAWYFTCLIINKLQSGRIETKTSQKMSCTDSFLTEQMKSHNSTCHVLYDEIHQQNNVFSTDTTLISISIQK